MSDHKQEFLRYLREVFDGDSVPAKNFALAKASTELEAQAKEITKLRSDLRLHAGDCASLSNELDLMREQRNISDVENAELHARIAELEWTVEELRRQIKGLP